MSQQYLLNLKKLYDDPVVKYQILSSTDLTKEEDKFQKLFRMVLEDSETFYQYDGKLYEITNIPVFTILSIFLGCYQREAINYQRFELETSVFVPNYLVESLKDFLQQLPFLEHRFFIIPSISYYKLTYIHLI